MRAVRVCSVSSVLNAPPPTSARAKIRQDPPTVVTLAARYNEIDEDGAEMLKKAIERSSTLESVYLMGTSIIDPKTGKTDERKNEAWKNELWDAWQANGQIHRWTSERSKQTLYRKCDVSYLADRNAVMPAWVLNPEEGGGGGKKKK